MWTDARSNIGADERRILPNPESRSCTRFFLYEFDRGVGQWHFKLLKAMKDYGLSEPEFIEMEIAFRINLYRSQVGLNTNQGTNQADQVNQVMDSLGREERQLVQKEKEKPEITQREMQGSWAGAWIK